MINISRYTLKMSHQAWPGVSRALGDFQFTEWFESGIPQAGVSKVELTLRGQAVGRVLVNATDADPWLAELSPARRKGCATLRIEGLVPEPGVAELLTYLGLRRARIDNIKTILVDAGSPVSFATRPIDSSKSALRAQQLDRASYQAFAALPDSMSVNRLFTDELAETIERWLVTIWTTGFFQSVNQETLSRAQYIHALENMHQFVRWTTRVLGRCVGHSHDRDLRNHYLDHLSGEINHERIIESDLEHLGSDTDFLLNHMVPNAGTRLFMTVQESIIGFHHDPVMLMASPLAAEGISAHLEPAFIDHLLTCIKGWGVENPERAVDFFASHVKADGGEHGHWLGGLKVVGQLLTSDQQHQEFLSYARASMSSLTAAYESYTSDVALFS